MLAVWRAFTIYWRSSSGGWRHLLRKWLGSACWQSRQDFDWQGDHGPFLKRDFTGINLQKPTVAVLITSASSDALISSSREFKAWETSGFNDAKVLDLSSVPYLCLTNLGRSGWINFSHARTTKFSKDGLNSSSSVTRSPWWDKLFALSNTSLTNVINCCYRSSGLSLDCKWMSAKSMKWAPVIWYPKCCLMVFQMGWIEVEFFTNAFLAIIGQ